MKISLAFLLILSNYFTYAQLEKPPRMLLSKGIYYSFDDNNDSLEISSSQVLKNLKLVDNTAYTTFKGARNIKFLSKLLTFTGGFFAGYAISKVIFVKEPMPGIPEEKNNALTYGLISAGALILSIPLNNTSYKEKKKAIRLYNEKRLN